MSSRKIYFLSERSDEIENNLSVIQENETLNFTKN